jgi:hypothetical protein
MTTIRCSTDTPLPEEQVRAALTDFSARRAGALGKHARPLSLRPCTPEPPALLKPTTPVPKGLVAVPFTPTDPPSPVTPTPLSLTPCTPGPTGLEPRTPVPEVMMTCPFTPKAVTVFPSTPTPDEPLPRTPMAPPQRAESLGAQLLLDRTDDPDEPLYVLADPAGHPFCIFVA